MAFLFNEERKAMSDPLYGHQPAEGLHVLKDAWCQKAHLGVQSRALAERGQLSAAIAATFAAAPVRLQGFRLDRSVAEDIQGVTRWMSKWKDQGWRAGSGRRRRPLQNRDLWQRLDRALSPHRIRFVWVAGHTGHPQNEEVDRLSRAAGQRHS
jgi:hypothetical protein